MILVFNVVKKGLKMQKNYKISITGKGVCKIIKVRGSSKADALNNLIKKDRDFDNLSLKFRLTRCGIDRDEWRSEVLKIAEQNSDSFTLSLVEKYWNKQNKLNYLTYAELRTFINHYKLDNLDVICDPVNYNRVVSSLDRSVADEIEL